MRPDADADRPASPNQSSDSTADVEGLLTVATLLQVSRSWVYEHTGARGTGRTTPAHQTGQVHPVRSARGACLSRAEMPTHVIPFPRSATIGRVLNHEESTDRAEQRVTPMGAAAVRAAAFAARHVAHLSTHVLLVGARQTRRRQSCRAVDGTRERRHDAERVHASARRRGARPQRRSAPNCSRLFTKRRTRASSQAANVLQGVAHHTGRFPQLPHQCGVIGAGSTRARNRPESGVLVPLGDGGFLPNRLPVIR
jgi:hypothetical protein